MAGFSEDFLRFLQANFPDVYRRASVADVKEDVVAAITSRYAYRYSLWQQVPEWVRNRYNDRIPTEVLNGNETPQELVQKELERYKVEAKKVDDSVDVAVSFLAVGYSAEMAAKIAEQRALRAKLLAENGEILPPELFSLWLESRQNDIQAIAGDWKDYQQEKYLVHLAKSLNREKMRAEKLSQSAEKQEAKMKIAAIERELKKVGKVMSEKGVAEKMVVYLRQPAQQAALHHFRPEVLELFTGVMQKGGVKVEPNKEKMPQVELGIGSLTASLREDFNRMRQRESILLDAATRDNTFRKITPNKVIDKRKDHVAKIVKMRRTSPKQQIA